MLKKTLKNIVTFIREIDNNILSQENLSDIQEKIQDLDELGKQVCILKNKINSANKNLMIEDLDLLRMELGESETCVDVIRNHLKILIEKKLKD